MATHELIGSGDVVVKRVAGADAVARRAVMVAQRAVTVGRRAVTVARRVGRR